MTRDERTTPRWLRVPVLLLLLLTISWFGLSYRFALGGSQPAWARPWPWVWWFANWEMFTLLDDHAAVIGADGLREGQWRRLDLEHLFPSRWESGPRYARPAFYKNPQYLRVLADSTCRRLDPKAEKVRFWRVSWKKQLGVSSRPPPKGLKQQPLLEWTCGTPVQRPQGVRF